MKRKILLILLLSSICFAANTEVSLLDTEGTRVDPGSVHTERGIWVVSDETTSAGDEPTDLAVTERTYKAVKRAIAAATSGDDEISVFDIPNSWNAINLRSVLITDAATRTDQVYLGTLGKGNRDADSTSADCELVNIGQLAWTAGTQESMYSQVAFTSGGTRAIIAGDTVTGATSGATATVRSVGTLTSGSWAGGDAAGTLQLISRNGTFQSENLDVTTAKGASSANSATIGADIIHFEFADTLAVTADTTWVKSWGSTSPAGDLAAMASIDVLNSDVIIIVTTVSSVDSKLLISGD